jgi:hypothetical protein
MKVQSEIITCSLGFFLVSGCGQVAKQNEDRARVSANVRKVLSCETTVSNIRNQDGVIVSGPTSCVSYEGAEFQGMVTELKRKCEVVQADRHVMTTFYAHGCDINSYTNKCVVKGSVQDQANGTYYNGRVLGTREMQAAKEACSKSRGGWYNF